MPHVLTLVANRAATTLTAAIIARVRDATGGGAAETLASGEAADIELAAAPDMASVRAVLDGAAIDAIATPAEGRRKALLVADMDSTIVTGETLDELADFAGLKDRIAAITARAMNGELDFKAALRERVAMLKGLPVDALERTWQRVRLTPGARELVATMRAHGAYTALVSGGFSFFTSRVAALCGFDLHRSNALLDDGAALIGRVGEPILDRDTKLATLTGLAAERGLELSATLGGWGWRQRPRHAACGRAGRGIPCQADRGGRGTGSRGSCRPARAAVRARLPGGGDRRAMAVIHGRYGPTHPRLGALAARIAHPLLRRYAAHYGFHTPDSAYARERGAHLRRETATRRAHLSGWHRTRRSQQRRGTDRGLARRRDPPDLQQRGGALQRHPLPTAALHRVSNTA